MPRKRWRNRLDLEQAASQSIPTSLPAEMPFRLVQQELVKVSFILLCVLILLTASAWISQTQGWFDTAALRLYQFLGFSS